MGEKEEKITRLKSHENVGLDVLNLGHQPPLDYYPCSPWASSILIAQMEKLNKIILSQRYMNFYEWRGK